MPTDSSRSGPRSTSASAPTPVPSGHVGHAGAVASFTRHLQSIDKLAAPDEWAIAAFRLALARSDAFRTPTIGFEIEAAVGKRIKGIRTVAGNPLLIALDLSDGSSLALVQQPADIDHDGPGRTRPRR